MIRDAEELERLITAPSKVQSAKDLLSKVTAHVETKQATMIPHVFHCTRCSGCNTFAPVCQEAHVQMFGLMASDHLDAMRWMKGLFEEKEVPIERFDLTKLPASVALAAFSFDESVFTPEGCQRLLAQLHDAIKQANDNPASRPLPPAVMAIGRDLAKTKKQTSTTASSKDLTVSDDMEVVQLMMGLLTKSSPPRRLTKSLTPMRLAPKLVRSGDSLEVLTPSEAVLLQQSASSSYLPGIRSQ